jgi:competence protein ComEA
MADQDDVRTRVEDALRRAAVTAYEAAHGAIDERDERAPSRWRWWFTPRVAVTVTVAVALVGSLIVFLPRDQARAPTALAASPGATAQVAADGVGQALPGQALPGQATVTVHVAGAVTEAGVYDLPAGARVADAIDAAGGTVEGADTDAVNLARVVADGEQIRVPVAGEPSVGDGLININTADAATLERLPGVGPVLAQRIVTHREDHGPFASVDGLDDVSGVGPSVLEQIRAAATV